MKNWKISIELNGASVEIFLQAASFSDAYVKAGLEYPGCRIKSISEHKT